MLIGWQLLDIDNLIRTKLADWVMESNFNNREFEQFVKQNADQYRMFPSEKVWKGIHANLHTRHRWYGLGLALLLLTSAAVTWVMLTPNNTVTGVAQTLASIQKASEVSSKKAEPARILATNLPPTQRTIPFNAGVNDPSPDHLLTGNTGIEEPVFRTSAFSAEMLSPVVASVVREKTEAPLLFYNTHKSVSIPDKNLLAVVQAPAAVTFEDYVRDNYPEPFHPAEDRQAAINESLKSQLVSEFPMTIESVLNSFRKGNGRKKISWQIYFAPTVSYRKLKENNDFRSSALASVNSTNYLYPVLSDINNMVTHKPDMGLELGFNAGYPISRSIDLTLGLQFNVSKYDIRAFSHPGEMATIALSTASGRRNSVSTVSTYRNFSGQKQSWLHNLYTSVSLPVGTQVKLPTSSKTYVGIGGNVQPTYIVGERAYLISTDFKNYAEVPWLIRRWNLATNVEIFAGFTTNKIKWKVGPQMRYQWLSSFEAKYPVKEHLFDFGLKVGVLLNQ